MDVFNDLRLDGPLLFAAVLAAGLLLAWLVHRLICAAMTRGLPADGTFTQVLKRARFGIALLVPLLVAQLALGAVPEWPHGPLARQALAIGWIVAFTWIAIRVLSAIATAMLRRHDVAATDNLRARRIHTQTRVLVRTAQVLVVIVGVAAVLMTFPGVRQIGASLLASAGVAGIVIGFAARPVLENLIAGLQIALTQPIRIDDVLIVDGEFGRVEEIGGANVVLRLWDDRRLVVPLNWFIQNPVENWTRTSAQLLGTVYWWVDYSVPVDAVREEVQRICEANPAWDRRACSVQVTEAGERAMQLRAVVSASDASRLWDLRCAVREGVLAFLVRHFPQALPRQRTELEADWVRAPHRNGDAHH